MRAVFSGSIPVVAGRCCERSSQVLEGLRPPAPEPDPPILEVDRCPAAPGQIDGDSLRWCLRSTRVARGHHEQARPGGWQCLSGWRQGRRIDRAEGRTRPFPPSKPGDLLSGELRSCSRRSPPVYLRVRRHSGAPPEGFALEDVGDMDLNYRLRQCREMRRPRPASSG